MPTVDLSRDRTALQERQVSQEFPLAPRRLRRYDVFGDDYLDAFASGYVLVKYQDTVTVTRDEVPADGSPCVQAYWWYFTLATRRNCALIWTISGADVRSTKARQSCVYFLCRHVRQCQFRLLFLLPCPSCCEREVQVSLLLRRFGRCV